MPFASPKPACDERAGAPIAAGIVFVAKDGDVLLLRRSADEKNYGGHWGLPGGKGEDGETAQDAATREFKEECGLDIDMSAGLKVMDRVDTPNGMQFTTFAKATDEKFVPTLDGEHSGYCWASLDMLPQPLHPSVAKCLGAHIGAADGAAAEDIAEVRSGLAAWARDETTELKGPVHVVRPKDWFKGLPGRGLPGGARDWFATKPAQDARLAMDRRAYDARGKRLNPGDVMALDRAPSSRVYDADGHLHISRTPISKANVCEYYGHEIPDAERLGLDPQRKYSLLRDPEELSKAAKSSNGKQLLLGHVPVSADDPQKDSQVGSTGTDAEFEFPYLYNSLHLHDREGIKAIETADQANDTDHPDAKGAKELSSAYRYRADMTPGEFHGVPYDGVMRDIDFNHVALVPEGRAGADVVVGDSKLQTKELTMKVLTRFAGASAVALGFYLEPRMAADSKIDLNTVFDGVTKKNFAARKAKIAADIKAKVVLAKDANLDDMHDFIDRLEKTDVAEGADEDPTSGEPMSKEDMAKKAKDEADEEEKKKAADKKSARDAFLTEKGMKAEDIAALDAMEAGDEFPEAKKDAEGKEGAKDKGAKDGEKVDKSAMDAAIENAATKVRTEMREAAEAREFVRPWAGALSMALDSAEAIHRAALDAVGVKHTGVHKDALKPILEAQPKPGETRRVATDALPAATGFHSRWGAETARIGGVS